MRQLTHQADVTVVGGGLAGVAAAVSAARNGARVTLIGNRPVLGGNSSSEVRVWVCGATAHGAQKFARETGVMGELFLENQWRNPEGNPILWDHVILDLVRREPGVTLFLNTEVRDVEASGSDDDRRIASVTGWQSGSEKLIRFESPVYIDCTGDGLVGLLAGARFLSGRESRSVFGEDWAPEVADDDMLGSTILFYTRDAGEPVRFVPPGLTRDIAATSIPLHRQISPSMNGCDYWWIEWGGELDAVDDNELIRDELWGIVFGIWDHIKNSGEHDAETLTLEWVGTVPGKREYRRFLGDHVLTQQDILDQVHFDDAVGFGGWSIDLHPPGGVYAAAAGSTHLHGPGLYEIPFRSLYSVNVSNMLMAGRDISASHVAFGTTRVMATCAVTGEAAGAGAALAARYGIAPRAVGVERLGELQSALLRQDASMPGTPWRGDGDLAFEATVSASSSLSELETTGDGVPYPIAEVDFGLVLPVDPRLDAIRLAVSASAPTDAVIELWGTGNGLTHIPVERLQTVVVPVAGTGRATIEARFDVVPDAPCAVVVVLRRNPALAVVIAEERPPYGVLALVSRAPRIERGSPQSNAWSAMELRRRSPIFEVEPATDAYRPDQAIGGPARPFGGPRLWASEARRADEHLELQWSRPQAIGSVELVFNDDPDEDLVNLHHHRTAFRAMPELVRDYRVEARIDGAWTTVAEVAGNRGRRRVHPMAVETDALRIVVTATNGDPHAMIVAFRAFSG